MFSFCNFNEVGRSFLTFSLILYFFFHRVWQADGTVFIWGLWNEKGFAGKKESEFRPYVWNGFQKKTFLYKPGLWYLLKSGQARTWNGNIWIQAFNLKLGCSRSEDASFHPYRNFFFIPISVIIIVSGYDSQVRKGCSDIVVSNPLLIKLISNIREILKCKS